MKALVSVQISLSQLGWGNACCPGALIKLPIAAIPLPGAALAHIGGLGVGAADGLAPPALISGAGPLAGAAVADVVGRGRGDTEGAGTDIQLALLALSLAQAALADISGVGVGTPGE